MASLLSSQASFAFAISGISAPPAVVRVTATEAVSSPFEVAVSLACEEELTAGDMVGRKALLTVLVGETARHFHGIIGKFAAAGRRRHLQLYQALLVPELWRLTLRRDCRIFQDCTVPEIVGTVLREGGLAADCFEFRLQYEGQPREYCVQYRESDFAFVSRLLEEEGIFYFFEHATDRHLLVFADSPTAYQSLPGEAEVPYHPVALEPEGDAIHRFSFARALSSHAFTHTDYNYQHPSHDLTTDFSLEGDGYLAEVYDFPGGYRGTERGSRLARLRLEAMRSLRETGSGASTCARFAPGFAFALTNHECSDINGKYVLLRVNHAGEQPQGLEEMGDGAFRYYNDFVAIPASMPFRQQSATPRAVVRGVQTATVVGPPGEEIYTDRYGRVKVQFHWDRKGKGDERSSCWLRTTQGWGGDRRGMLFTPRVGDEVLVDFLEGDPDRPIVVGSVYNERNLPPCERPVSKSASAIKTRSCPGGAGTSELRFDDRRGHEDIYLHGQRDWNIDVGNDKRQVLGRDETLRIGNDRIKWVGVDQEVRIGKNHSESIGGDKQVTVGENRSERIAGNSAEMVGAAKELSVGGLYQATIGGAMNEIIVGAKAEEVGGTRTVLVGAHMTECVSESGDSAIGGKCRAVVAGTFSVMADSIFLTGADEIIFRTGKAVITLRNDGMVVVLGGNITSKAAGQIKTRGKSITKTQYSGSEVEPEKQNYSQQFDFSEMHAAGNYNEMDFAGMPVVITKKDGSYITTLWTDENGVTDRVFTEEPEEIVAWAGKGGWELTEEFELIEVGEDDEAVGDDGDE